MNQPVRSLAGWYRFNIWEGNTHLMRTLITDPRG